jgi:hypothetical protein
VSTTAPFEVEDRRFQFQISIVVDFRIPEDSKCRFQIAEFRLQIADKIR